MIDDGDTREFISAAITWLAIAVCYFCLLWVLK